MERKNDIQFTCHECGGHKLAYKKYFYCTSPVSVREDVRLEYGQPEINSCSKHKNRFICINCEEPVTFCGFEFFTEKRLIKFLAIDPDLRQETEDTYIEDYDSISEYLDEKIDEFLDRVK